MASHTTSTHNHHTWKPGWEQETKTHLITFQRIPVVFPTPDANLRCNEIHWVTGHVGIFVIRMCQEQRRILSSGNAGGIKMHISTRKRERMRAWTHSNTSIPLSGALLVGFVALLGSSGPSPSSPTRLWLASALGEYNNKGRTVGSILTPGNSHGRVVLFGRECPMRHSSTAGEANLASPYIRCKQDSKLKVEVGRT